MPDLKESGYDQIQLANGTRSEVEAAKGKLNTFEPVIITDEDKFAYKDAQGNLKDVAFGDSNELRGLIDQNKSDIDQNKSDILSKLDKGSFTGTADNLRRVYVREISSSIDFNTLTDEGAYLINIATNPDTSTNAPPSLQQPQLTMYCWGTLIVEKCKTNHLHVTQTYYPHNAVDGATTRVCFNNDWSKWQQPMTVQNCPISKQPIGYCKLANGLIIQWGVSGVNFPLYDTYGVLTVNFPISFSDTGFSLITKGIVNAGDVGGEQYLAYQTITNQNLNNSASVFKVGMRCVDSNFATGRALKWIAVGY